LPINEESPFYEILEKMFTLFYDIYIISNGIYKDKVYWYEN